MLTYLNFIFKKWKVIRDNNFFKYCYEIRWDAALITNMEELEESNADDRIRIYVSLH